MRATLAIAVLVALAMSATPTLAADRTVQSSDDRESALLTEWIVELELAWVGLVLPGVSGLVTWSPPVPTTVDDEPEDDGEAPAREQRKRVILEDGAPF